MASRAVKLVTAIFLVGILTAFLMPVAINAIAGDSSTTLTQNAGNTGEVKVGINATLDSVTADTDATYTITAGGDSATTSALTAGSNETVTVDGAEVTVEVDSVGTDSATATFDYPTTYGWGSGATAMWVILPVILVLAVFLYIVFMATNRL